MNDKANLIVGSSLGAELSDSEVAILGALMDERNLADDEFLFEDGTADDSLHIILTGKVEVVKRTGDDNFASLAVLREGELAGELSFHRRRAAHGRPAGPLRDACPVPESARPSRESSTRTRSWSTRSCGPWHALLIVSCIA